MCGIGGILRVYPPGVTPSAHEESIPESWLDILDASIKHRGPDGQGRFRDRAEREDGSIVDVALVHRRLSIIDLAGGAQPMVSRSRSFPRTGGLPPRDPSDPNPSTFRGLTLPVLSHGSANASVEYRSIPGVADGLLAVVFNGCIYNHRELRGELQAKGHHFATDHSDTEVLLHGWREWGVCIGEHVDAMGAWMVWDRVGAELVAWRGETGEKPIFVAGDSAEAHAARPGGWVFSSGASGAREVCRSMRLCEGADRGGAARRVLERGFGSPWERVRALPPARYPWSVPGERGGRIDGLQDRSPDHHHHQHAWVDVRGDSVEERVERALGESVAARLEADVPVACLLSGGVDSSLVCLLAARAGRDIRTFCVRMPDPRFDESAHASAIADMIGTRHETLEVRADPASDLVRLIETIGVPFGDSSLLPTYWAFDAAAHAAKVVLTGDGGDELFLGYERYQAARAVHMLGRARGAARAMSALLTCIGAGVDPKSKMAKAQRLAEAAAGAGYEDILRIFPSSMRRALVPSARVVDFPARHVRRPADAAAFELGTSFPDGLLAKVDHASLLAGVEARAPFLARSVRQLARSLPESALMPHGQRKGLLRAVARRYLPAEIVDRPKMGFAIPIGEWFRSDFGGLKALLHDMLHAADPFPASVLGEEIDRRFVERMLDEHMGERRDHSQRLYMLLVLAIWCRWMGSLGKGAADARR